MPLQGADPLILALANQLILTGYGPEAVIRLDPRKPSFYGAAVDRALVQFAQALVRRVVASMRALNR